ncbi:MAG: hypothetical protein GEU90_04255 [Gemmatimonas sp.]|nr:hypothetical protein [Gemmatimonas sp.]
MSAAAADTKTTPCPPDAIPSPPTRVTIGCLASDRGRPLHRREQWILDLWNKLHLSQPDFTGRNLVAFLKQVENRLLGLPHLRQGLEVVTSTSPYSYHGFVRPLVYSPSVPD